jgi:acetyl esterase
VKQLDPQVRALLDADEAAARGAAAAPGGPPDPAAARAQYRSSRAALRPPIPDVAALRNIAMPGPGGELALRLYRGLGTAAETPLPAVVYFHGGGWVVGDLETHDVVCRQLANAAKCVLIAVDYRLAPEHKFPAAVDDSLAAVRWVAAHAGELGVDAARIAVAGDSAGANLATVTAIALRDQPLSGDPQLAMQLLAYPVTDLGMETPSYLADTARYMLTRDDMLWYRGHYLRSEADIADWRASPLRAADLSGLPPAYLLTAGFDPLLDEGRAYAGALRAAGVDVTYECFEGQIHGFLLMGGALAASQHAIYRLAQGLTRELARAAAARAPEPDGRAFRLLRP